ncbi:hypothetical protein EV356DRAFT_572524 [Viridothelium virens]|uniref:Uncharacterized protein n=1 Tax=Viridothelium virens TaxID=1048519 RepID=A0A6A6HQP4_VIRVR|nr:hypothetical protein EV356DRAFT_572524 [Viridothelium virens]
MPSDLPTILASTSLEPTSLSLSNPTRHAIILTLHLRLINSTEPLTLYCPSSFLNTVQPPYGSFWVLENAQTGVRLRSPKAHGLRAPTATINLANDESLTLYTDRTVSRNIMLGPSSSAPAPSDAEEEAVAAADPLHYLNVCGTKLSLLEAGQRYKIVMRNPPDSPFHVHWYAKGEVADLAARFGKTEITVELLNQSPMVELDGLATELLVEE